MMNTGSRGMNGILGKTWEFIFKLLNLDSPFWDCNNTWYNGLGARLYLCYYWEGTGSRLSQKYPHPDAGLNNRSRHSASPCHNDFWDADAEWNAGVAEVWDHLVEMLSSFRELQSNPGEKNIHVVDKALDFGSNWRALSACTKQGLPKDRNTPGKAPGCILVTAPSDHSTGCTAPAANGDSWKDLLALTCSTKLELWPILCWGRSAVKAVVLL